MLALYFCERMFSIRPLTSEGNVITEQQGQNKYNILASDHAENSHQYEGKYIF